MTDGSRDWMWASLAGAGLLGIALLIVFVIHPGASNGQVGWYMGLLPGSIVGAILTGAVESYLPRAQSIVYLLSLLVASFLWYVAIAFVIVKVVRATGLRRKG